jgi:hypothetical protein
MPFDHDPIQASIEPAIHELGARLADEVRAIVDQVVAEAAHAQEEAVASARTAALAEAAERTERQLADARTEERRAAEAETQCSLEAEVAQKIAGAVAAAHDRAREGELTAASRLLESIRGFDGAASLSEVLDVLAMAAARETSRVAVLVMRNGRLTGWKLTGFGAQDAHPKAIDLALDEAGLLGVAATAVRPVTSRESHGAGEPAFLTRPIDQFGLAVPLVVGGRTVALVYADSVTHEGRQAAGSSAWPDVVEVLARHAGRCLEAMTAIKATTGASPRLWPSPGAGVRRSDSPAAPPPAATDTSMVHVQSDARQE